MRPMVDPYSIARAWQRAGETGPPVDLYETADAVIVRVALPGADGTSISLTITEESLSIKGESGAPARWGARTLVHWQEIPYGRFDRTIPLPAPVNKNGAKAGFKNGVLEVTLPKQSGPAARTVQITVT
jgi:HSP20 family protein